MKSNTKHPLSILLAACSAVFCLPNTGRRYSRRGLFIHAELIKPRRSNPSGRAGNDQIAPDPGFTEAQYEKLALAYVVASVRAGKCLLPGFHAVIDSGISNGHDDPQIFTLLKFDTTLNKVINTINGMTH